MLSEWSTVLYYILSKFHFNVHSSLKHSDCDQNSDVILMIPYKEVVIQMEGIARK